MQDLNYQGKSFKREMTRQEVLDSYSHPTSLMYDIVAPLVCIFAGLTLYAWTYWDAWHRLGLGAFFATSAAVATQLIIETAVTVGVTFFVARSVGFYLGEMWMAVFRVSAAIVLFDALATWIARTTPVPVYTPDGPSGYIDDLMFFVWFGCPVLLVILFRMSFEEACRAGPWIAVAYGATNLIILVYFTKPLLEIGSFAAWLAHMPIPLKRIPLFRPHRIWYWR
jgi:hypothetical protein